MLKLHKKVSYLKSDNLVQFKIKLFKYFLFTFLCVNFFLFDSQLKANDDFDSWVTSYKKYAENKGISNSVLGRGTVGNVSPIRFAVKCKRFELISSPGSDDGALGRCRNAASRC